MGLGNYFLNDLITSGFSLDTQSISSTKPVYVGNLQAHLQAFALVAAQGPPSDGVRNEGYLPEGETNS